MTRIKWPIDEIKQFLVDNPTLSHMNAAITLSKLGFECSDRTVSNYRERFKIQFIRPMGFNASVREAVASGKVFKSPDELMAKYGMGRSHANKLMREINNFPKPKKREPVVRTFAPPMRIGSAELMISQLTCR